MISVILSLSEESRKGLSADNKFNIIRINEGLDFLQSLLEEDNSVPEPPAPDTDGNKSSEPKQEPQVTSTTDAQEAAPKTKKTIKEKIKDKVASAGDKVVKTWNDIKLSWEGVKSKTKEMSAKEQEMCRDLDMEFNNVLRNAKNYIDSPGDKRAELITGQVNHSISKTLKIGLGLAAVGAAAGSYVLPILGAIGLYAKSKHLSDKEKKSFYEILFPLMTENLQRVTDDLEWFCDKFDYKNKDADWKNSRDAVQRGMQKAGSGYPADPPYKADL